MQPSETFRVFSRILREHHLDEVVSVVDPGFMRMSNDERLYSYQHHNFIYPRLVPGGGEFAQQGLFSPVDLTSMEVLIEPLGPCVIAPFHEYFLIGTGDKMLLVSMNGELVEYPLPYRGGMTYSVVEYKK